jgi:hypothetical protein
LIREAPKEALGDFVAHQSVLLDNLR